MPTTLPTPDLPFEVTWTTRRVQLRGALVQLDLSDREALALVGLLLAGFPPKVRARVGAACQSHTNLLRFLAGLV